MSQTLSNAYPIGSWAVHVPTGVTFQVKCNCPNSMPRHHTRRAILEAPHDYRPLTTPPPTAKLNLP